MLFNSLEFVLFLPVVFLLYWFVFRQLQWQNLFVVVASYVFYGWWSWTFLLLIAFTSACSYVSGLLIEEDRKRSGKYAKLYATLNICINLFILGVYKYYNFFAESLVEAFSSLGVTLSINSLNLVLPVGISFYTFQALSYTIDVYRRKLEPTHNPIEFFAFISFFPQLVAGPIERATNLLPQFQKPRTFQYETAVDGCRLMLWGFFKKLVIADNCAMIVNNSWGHYYEYPGMGLFMLGILFTFQIYCDFSGYSDIAIGCARLFGFNLMRNFDIPYFSRSIPEFWRRWHISLTTWFRDYIYFPLGGSRCEKWKIIRNVYLVWGISGLWHGASWHFVFWGLFHATLLAIYNLIGVKTKYANVIAYDRFYPSIIELIQVGITFFFVVVGWIIFRADSMSQASQFLYCMFVGNPMVGEYNNIFGKELFLAISFLLLVEWLQRDKLHPLQFDNIKPFNYRIVRWGAYYCLIKAIFAFTGKSQSFIYFQF